MKEQIDKQAVEEMAKHCAYYHNGNCKNTHPFVEECDLMCDMFGTFANLEKAGYRKQSEGEWETIPDYQPNKLITYRHICSVCKTFYKDIRPHGHKYCHECGAKMKGGKE